MLTCLLICLWTPKNEQQWCANIHRSSSQKVWNVKERRAAADLLHSLNKTSFLPSGHKSAEMNTQSQSSYVWLKVNPRIVWAVSNAAAEGGVTTWLPCVNIISFYYLEPNTRCHLFVNVLVVKSMSMFTGETGNDVGSLAPGLWKARCAVTEASVLSSNQLLCFFIIYYNVELKWGVYSAL